MKQIWITKKGGPEVLAVREAPDPRPEPGEITVDVRAAGVNFADVLARMGMYPDAPPFPCVVGYEVAGIVREAGSAVRRFAPGDRVVALTRFGGHATVVSVPESQAFAIPDQASFAEAAALPVQYFTAYLAAHVFGNVQAGERLLVHNAGGGVGIAAIQLARRAGATVFGTASEWKHERLRHLGAHTLIDYRRSDWVAEIQRLAEQGTVHVILDPLGGGNIRRDLRVLAPLGRLVSFGFSEPVHKGRRSIARALTSLLRMPRPHMLRLLNRNWSMAGLNLGHLWSELDRMHPIAEALVAAWRAGEISPVVSAEVPFDEPGEAHLQLQERRNFGKVVLVPVTPRRG